MDAIDGATVAVEKSIRKMLLIWELVWDYIRANLCYCNGRFALSVRTPKATI
jgi:hypothetical protein